MGIPTFTTGDNISLPHLRFPPLADKHRLRRKKTYFPQILLALTKRDKPRAGASAMSHKRTFSLRLPQTKQDETLSVAVQKKKNLAASAHLLPPPSQTFSQEELEKIGTLGIAYAMTATISLSAPQRTLLRFSWQHVGKHGPGGIGEMIFSRIFKKEPEVRKVFNFGLCPVSELAHDESFEKHAQVFVGVIDEAVESLDNLKNFAPKLIRYGMRHAGLQVIGFKPEWWEVFAEAMTESAIEWTGSGGRHRDTIRAWTILLSYIVDKMRFGYDMEIKAIRRATGSPTSYSLSASPNRSRSSSNASNYSRPMRED